MEAVAELDRQIEVERRAARAFQDQLAALQVRATDEADQARQRAYEVGVDAVAKILPRRERAAVEVESAVKALAAAVGRYISVTELIVRDWPVDVPRPGSTGFGAYFSGHYLTLDHLGATLRDCFSPSMRRPVPQLFVARAARAAECAAGLAEAESANSAALLEELRSRGVPKPVVADDIEEAA